MKDELITAGLALIGAALVAVLTWWLTERSRNVAEAAKERAVAEALLGAQSDTAAVVPDSVLVGGLRGRV